MKKRKKLLARVRLALGVLGWILLAATIIQSRTDKRDPRTCKY